MQSSAERQSYPVAVDVTAPAPTLPGAGTPASTAVVADPEWYRQGTAAHEGLNRTDPEVRAGTRRLRRRPLKFAREATLSMHRPSRCVFPQAVWSFQGFAFVGWSTPEKASWLKGFVDAVPAGRFNVIDMGYSGQGEWQKLTTRRFSAPNSSGRG